MSVLPVNFEKMNIADGKLEVMLMDSALAEMSIYAIYTSRNPMASELRALLDYLDECFKTDEYLENIT